jgi:hypothetical protein
VLQVIQNVLNVVVTLATLVMVFYIVIAGLQFIMSGSGGEALSKAKTRITNVVIGIVVVLVAWLLIDYVMKTIYEEGKFGPWNTILAGNPTGTDRCIIATKPSGISSGFTDIVSTSPGETPGAPSGPGGTGGGCTPIPDSSLVAIDNAGHKLIPNAATRFKAMKAAAARSGVTLSVSSAYRSPEEQLAAWNNNGCSLVNGRAVCRVRTAAVPCSLGGTGSNHTRGTAVDITLASGVYSWLRNNASQYGFYNQLPNDLPHWSDTGR